MHQEQIVTTPRLSAAPLEKALPSLDSTMEKDSPVPHLTLREDRGSFTSVKEDDCGTAQSFIFSNTSSLNQPCSNNSAIIDEDETSASSNDKHNEVMLPQNACSSCGNRRVWKQIPLGGIKRSRSWSVSDLKLSGEKKFKVPEEDLALEQTTQELDVTLGRSRLEALPTEILDCIIPLLAVDTPTNGYSPRNIDLMSCLLTSRTLYFATLPTLYGRVTFPHSYIFSKFLNRITEDPSLGRLVRRLDFSHFTNVGFGRTKRMNNEIQNLTSQTLLKCLELTPSLREFLVQQHLDDDLSEAVIEKVFCGLPVMDAVDFCGSSSASFRKSFEAVLNPRNVSLPAAFSIRRLCLHECNTLNSSVFEAILPRLPYLTHLDVCHTQITEVALQSIPKTARLTHLNLGKCSRLSGSVVVDFLTKHPATKDTLIYLNLLSDLSRYRLLALSDVERLLPQLPSTLRALNLSGAKITSEHVPLLLPLTKHVEELSLGFSQLSISDLNALFMPARPSSNDDEDTEEPGMTEEAANWIPHTITYLDVTGIASVTPSALFHTDSCVLLSSAAQPLGVLEIGDKLIETLKLREPASKRLGWTVKDDLKKRGWYVRTRGQGQVEKDSGWRDWKMGALGWGMRKIPVTRGEVGGLYGFYMFQK